MRVLFVCLKRFSFFVCVCVLCVVCWKKEVGALCSVMKVLREWVKRTADICWKDIRTLLFLLSISLSLSGLTLCFWLSSCSSRSGSGLSDLLFLWLWLLVRQPLLPVPSCSPPACLMWRRFVLPRYLVPLFFSYSLSFLIGWRARWCACVIVILLGILGTSLVPHVAVKLVLILDLFSLSVLFLLFLDMFGCFCVLSEVRVGGVPCILLLSFSCPYRSPLIFTILFSFSSSSFVFPLRCLLHVTFLQRFLSYWFGCSPSLVSGGLPLLLLPLLSCLICSLGSGNKENLLSTPFNLPYFSTFFVVVSRMFQWRKKDTHSPHLSFCFPSFSSSSQWLANSPEREHTYNFF
jgi:hypothetical protein